MLAAALVATVVVLLVLVGRAARDGRGAEMHRSASASELADWVESLQRPIPEGTDPFG